MLKIKNKILPLIISTLYFALHLFNIKKEEYGYPLYSAIVMANKDNLLGILKTSLDPIYFFAVGKPPLPLFFQFLSTNLFGFNALGFLLPVLLASLLSGFILRRIILEIYPTEKSYLAVLLYLSTPVTFVLSRVNIADSLFILFLLVALLALLKYQNNKHVGTLIVSLVMIFFAGYCKFYMTLLTSLAFFVLLLDKKFSIKEKIYLNIFYLLSFLLPPIFWAISYYLLPGKRPFLGGTGDSNPFNLIFLSQGLGRVFSSITGNKLDFPVMPQTMAYPVYQRAGFNRLFQEPYLSQYGYFFGFLLVAIVVLVIFRRQKTLTTRHLSLPLWGAGSFLGISLSQGPVCCTHPYYTSLLLPTLIFAFATVFHFNNIKLMLLGAFTNLLIVTYIFYSYPEQLFLKSYLVFGSLLFILILISKIKILNKIFSDRATALLVAVLTLLPLLLVTSYTYSKITLADRYGDPVAGIYGKDTSEHRLVTVTLDNNHQVTDVGQDTSLVEKLNPKLVNLIKNSPSTVWASATLRAYIAAPLQIATGRPILTTGGETGSESTITAKDFEKLVNNGELCYFTMGSRDVLWLSNRHSISKYSNEAYRIAVYVLDHGIRIPLTNDVNAPALFALCPSN